MPLSGNTVQFLLLVLLLICAVVGNGFICCLIFRFKTLRTIPNVLVIDLTIVDGLNASINLSLFIAYFQLEILRGRVMAVLTEACYRCFLFLSLTTKLLLMLDRYFVVTHGIRYTIWKSRAKVRFIIMIKWLFCLAASVGSSSALWKIDLGDTNVLDYRGQYLETNGKMFIRLAILINHGLYLCLAVAAFFSIRKTNEEFRGKISKNTAQAALIKASYNNKVKASKTIAILISCDFVFYLPMLLYLYLVLTPGFERHGWFSFIAHYFLFVSNVNNPVIYFSRTQRFRLALLKMLRDPCGSSELFEFRTLPAVKVVPQKRVGSGHVTKNTASKKPQRRQTRALDSFEMESNAAVNLATLQEYPERKSNDRSSASIDDFPVAFVHRSTSNEDGPESKPFHRQVNVILSNRRSERKRKCSAKELKDGNKPGTEKSESSMSNFSSRDNKQESALSLSEESLDSYDTWL